MKSIILAMAAILQVAPAFAADAADCYVISDPDVRALCRAKAHADSSICYSIKRQNIRAQCMAETRR
ncbi:hypothetical protein [Aeromonas hydrophila]|uniref:hypothetical protein n=1 Tax=Aeromonas TaxID=642 RepID=UPI002361E9A8|nr:hypothetical protein [Aeromonas hydrophila]